MTWLQNVDATTNKAITDKALQPKLPVTPISPLVAQNLAANKLRAGWIPIEQLMALSKANATPETVDMVGVLNAKNIVDLQATDEPPSRSWKNKIYDPLKAATRWSAAAFNFAPEFAQGGLAQIFDDNTDIDGWFISTTLGSMIEDSDIQGEGFFASKELMDKQAERARRYRGTINGSGWTFGRQSASLVFKPKSLPYNIMSGVIDAMVLLRFDPTGAFVRTYRGAQTARFAVPIGAVGDPDSLRAVIAEGIGLSEGVAEHALDSNKYFRFMRENPRAQAFVKIIRDEKNPRVLAEEVFDHKMDPEFIGRLALAKTDDEVIMNLATGWSLEGGGLPVDIRELQGTRVGQFIVDRLPLIDGIRKSRAFTTIPKNLIMINGSRFDNADAVKTVTNYLRTAGATVDEVDDAVKGMVNAFTDLGTDAEKFSALKTFTSTLKIAMVRNGANPTVVDDMLSRGTKAIDDMRLYMISREGAATDNGLFQHLVNQNQEYVPNEELDMLFKMLGTDSTARPVITSPLQLVEMINRVQVFPPIREIRRVTTNQYFAKALEGVGLDPQRFSSIAGKAEVRTFQIVEKVSGEKFASLGDELSELNKNLLGTPEMSALKKSDPAKYKVLVSEQVALKEKIVALQTERNALTKTVTRKVLTGKQAAAANVIDYMQNSVWKPLTLMTGGYVMRNSIDAQARMAISGLASAVTHPFEYINLVLGKSKRIDIDGNLITGTTLDDVLGDHKRLWEFGARQAGLDPQRMDGHMVKSGAWANARRDQGPIFHTQGVSQTGRLIHEDPLQKIVAQTFVEMGSSDHAAQTVAAQRVYNTIKANPEIEAELRQLYAAGFQITDPETGKTARLAVRNFGELDADELKTLLTQHAHRVPVANVATQSGAMPDMEFMQAFNRVPMLDKAGKRVASIQIDAAKINLVDADKGLRVGAEVQLGDEGVGIITKLSDGASGTPVIDPFTGELVDLQNKVATIVPVHLEDAFGANGSGTKEAKNLIASMQLHDGVKGLPRVVKREVYVGEGSEGPLASLHEAMDKSTDWFFGQFYGTISRKLERSPVFRQYYYETVIAQADSLAPDEAQKVLDRIRKYAAEEKMSVRKYVGDEGMVKALQASTKTAGTATAEHLDDYAKFVSLTKMKALLYDASDRSNFGDAMRIVAPFASAWREIVGTYVGFLADNPVGVTRNFQRIYTGAKGADPDNDGRGIVFQNPQTGQMMFSFPVSGPMAKFFTGLNAGLTAPVARVSQGVQAYPAIGPIMQVAVSKLMPDVPETDFITKMLLPYGRKSGIDFQPGWFNKFTQALRANEKDTSTTYFNTYIETVRAMSASGDYDLSDSQQVQQLEKDAKFKARILTGFRAASQFFGPTAATTEFKVPTGQGDIFVGDLIKEFYRMQADPKIGYDGAVPEFLKVYGDEAALYVSSKSRSLVEGQEATEVFGAWERRNGDLLKQFPDVAAYLAPTGSDFDFSVWDRQLSQGTRVKLSDNEMIELSQQRIGASLYRAAQQQVGPKPSDEARALLRRYRTFLHGKYPGFPEFVQFQVGKYYNDIDDLKTMLATPKLADDPTAETIRQFLSARDQAIAASGVSVQGFKSAASAARIRAALYSIGLVLSDRDPNFQRIFDRFFSSEIE